jgi:hypothetical protein
MIFTLHDPAVLLYTETDKFSAFKTHPTLDLHVILLRLQGQPFDEKGRV